MVRVCSNCNNMFEDIFGKYTMCPDCRELEEDLLRRVKDYLWDNPGTTEKKLKEVFEVSHEQIMMWLRDERIEITPDSDIVLTCERCGSMIFTGKYCKDCSERIKRSVNEIKDSLEPKPEKKVKMIVNRSSFKDSKMRFIKED